MILQLKDRASQLRQVIAPRPYQLFSREFHITDQTPTAEAISNTPTLKRERGRGEREEREGERGERGERGGEGERGERGGEERERRERGERGERGGEGRGEREGERGKRERGGREREGGGQNEKNYITIILPSNVVVSYCSMPPNPN